MPIALTNENYFSPEADRDYMSVSQFKDFAGNTVKRSCEETAYLKYTGVIPKPTTTALLVGSFIDSYFEGTLDEFLKNNPSVYSSTGATKGQLKADFKNAQAIIDRLERDPLFKQYMSGDKQVIMTASLFGVDWKIKIDSYHAGDKIVDLKIMKDMKPIWIEDIHQKVDFIHAWGYDIQGAIYQKIVEINTGYRLPFYIACGTKETITDYNIIEVTQPHLDAALEYVRQNIQRVIQVKTGLVEPARCGHCPHCLGTKVLEAPITIDDIMPVKLKDFDGSEEFDEE